MNKDDIFGMFIITAFLVVFYVSEKLLLISFAGIEDFFLNLIAVLFVSSLTVMFLIAHLSKLKEVETSIMWERFLNATIFVVFTSLFGLILFLPITHYTMGYIHMEVVDFYVVGITVLISLVLAKITVRLIEGKISHIFEENKKHKKATSAG